MSFSDNCIEKTRFRIMLNKYFMSSADTIKGG